MGRQDNVEIFEDTQRLYSSNVRLISAIKNSSAAQECFTGTGRHWYGPEHRIYQKPAQTVISPKRTLEAAAPYAYAGKKTSVYKGYKQDKIEMRGDRAEMSDFPLYLNTVAGGLDCRDQTIGGFSFVVKIYALPVVEIIG